MQFRNFLCCVVNNSLPLKQFNNLFDSYLADEKLGFELTVHLCLLVLRYILIRFFQHKGESPLRHETTLITRL